MARNDEMVELFKSGKTLREIGDRYGISFQRVWYIVKQSGINLRDYGQKIKVAKKYKELAEVMQETYVYGETVTDLQEKLQISRGVLVNIRKKYNIKANKFTKDGTQRLCTICGKVDDIENFNYIKNGKFHTWIHKPCRICKVASWQAYNEEQPLDEKDLPEWVTFSQFVKWSGILPGNFKRLELEGVLKRKRQASGQFLYHIPSCKQAIIDGKITCSHRRFE